MKKGILALLILFLPVSVFGQNLFTNPGFENGLTGWDSFYSREPSTGSVSLVSSPVNSGIKAVHILHTGKEDWSFKHNGNINVKPGEIYEFSAFCFVENPGDWSRMSYILYDSLGNVIEWTYSILPFEKCDSYQKFTVRIIVPAGTGKIAPRFTGGGECGIFIDDIEVKYIGVIQGDKYISLNGNQFDVSIAYPSFEMNILNKANGKRYTSAPLSNFIVNSVDSSSGTASFNCINALENGNLKIVISLISDGLKFEIIPLDNSALNNPFSFPGGISSSPGDFLVLPIGTGVIFPVEEDYPLGTLSFFGWKCTMSLVGATDLSSGYFYITSAPWDTQASISKPYGFALNTPVINHAPSKKRLGYARTLYLRFVDNGGYVEIARKYREYAESAGYIKTFDDKIKQTPAIEKLKGAVDFWIQDGAYQRTDFIDSLKYSGLDKAIFSLLGGWYASSDLWKLIDSINARGFLSSRYDIYTDVFPPLYPQYPWYRTEGYPEDVIIDANDSLHKGWLSYINNGTTPFQGYYTCSATHSAYARKYLPADLAKNRYNCRFIDVECASNLMECYSKVHPVSRMEDALYRKELLSVIKNEFNLVTGSEEAREWAFPVVDYGEGTMSIVPPVNSGYDWSGPLTEPGKNFIDISMNAAKRIPLHGLIYHDSHVPTWYTGDGVSKVPAYWDYKDLFNILYASMPLFMPPDMNYWARNKERFITSANLVSAVSRSCGFSKMVNHLFLSGDRLIQQSRFENGWEVTANFSPVNAIYNNNLIPPKGFFATDGKYYSYRLQKDNGIVSAARLEDRLFISPSAGEAEIDGLRTAGTAFLQKTVDGLNLTFIGNQNYVDINPLKFPWPVKNIGVRGRYKQKAVTPQSLTDGWVRINKADGETFYIISGDFITSADKQKSTGGLSFYLSQNYPNPFNIETAVEYSIPAQGPVKIVVYNPLGQETALLENSVKNPGKYTAIWNGSDKNGKTVSSGVYFLKLTSGEYCKIIKLNILK
jgi:hypothetical protein